MPIPLSIDIGLDVCCVFLLPEREKPPDPETKDTPDSMDILPLDLPPRFDSIVIPPPDLPCFELPEDAFIFPLSLFELPVCTKIEPLC